jgi:serine/threonine protein kinase
MLPLGATLGEFEVTGAIGEGGFSIVYLAWDHSLERKVALKEYMPASLAARVGDTRVDARSERHRDTFEAGLKSFINEAKLLALFDHPSLVKVYRFWEANGTAYMVMPFYEGLTVKETVRALQAPPDEAWLLGLLTPLTEALMVLHAEHCYHRDIAPDNVILLAGSGKPLLLDFGAARRVIGDMTESLTVILKPGYAPIEQYGEVPGMKQGPWTDVYALAALVYWAVAGKTPPPSVSRMLNDSYVPLAEVAAGRYRNEFLRAIDLALTVLPERRTRSIEALRRDLGLGPKDPSGPSLLPTWDDPDATVIRRANTALVPEAERPAEPPWTAKPPPARPARSSTAASPPTADESSSRRPPTPAAVARVNAAPALPVLAAAAVVVVVVVVASAIWWALQEHPVHPKPAAPIVVDASPPSPAAPEPAASPPRPSLSPPVTPPVPAPRSPAEAFVLAADRSDATFKVVLRAAAPQLTIGRDPLRLSLSSSEAGYLYVFGYREGSSELELLHPTAADSKQRVSAGVKIDLRVAGWNAAAPPTPGAWQLLAMVSRQPLDLPAAGWRTQDHSLVRAFGRAEDSTTQVWGSTICAPGGSPCNEAYGSARTGVTLMPDPGPPIAAKEPSPRPSTTSSQTIPTSGPTGASPKASKDSSPGPGSSAECASILQRQSLGDTSAELIERLQSLRCR